MRLQPKLAKIELPSWDEDEECDDHDIHELEVGLTRLAAITTALSKPGGDGGIRGKKAKGKKKAQPVNVAPAPREADNDDMCMTPEGGADDVPFDLGDSAANVIGDAVPDLRQLRIAFVESVLGGVLKDREACQFWTVCVTNCIGAVP